tara:strand:- start:1204 stop:1347 length:144 start_codon:yes stop_codon:yes gene_type:complete
MSNIDIEIKSVQKEILKAKTENKPPIVIQKLQQRLDKLSQEKKNGTL